MARVARTELPSSPALIGEKVGRGRGGREGRKDGRKQGDKERWRTGRRWGGTAEGGGFFFFFFQAWLLVPFLSGGPVLAGRLLREGAASC